MSKAVSLDLDSLPSPICDNCGFQIEDAEQDCIALDEGRCAP